MMDRRRALVIALLTLVVGCRRCSPPEKAAAAEDASTGVDAGLAGAAEILASADNVGALEVTDREIVWFETPIRKRGEKREDVVLAIPKNGGERRTIAQTATRPRALVVAGSTVAWVETFDSARGHDLFFAPVAGGAARHIDGHYGRALAASGGSIFFDDTSTVREIVPPSESSRPAVTERAVSSLCATPSRLCWGVHEKNQASIRCQGRVDGVADELIEEPKIDLVGCGEHYLAYVRVEKDKKTSLVAYEFANKSRRTLEQWSPQLWLSPFPRESVFRETDDALYYTSHDTVIRQSLGDGNTTRLFPYEGPFAVDRTHIYFVFDHAIRRLPR